MGKITKYKNQILAVLAIVAASIILPTVIGYFMNTLSSDIVIYLVYFALLIAAGVLFAINFGTSKKISVTLPLLLLEAAQIVVSINSLITNNAWTDAFYIGIAVAIVLLFLISNGNKKMDIAVVVLVAIQLGFAVASLFGGNLIGLSRTILLSLLTYYLLTKNGEEKNEEV